MIISVNGKLHNGQDTVISALDHGFLYGLGLFETFRTYNGTPFLLEQHMERLRSGCSSLGIQWDADPDAIRHQITEMLQASGLRDAYVRYTVTAGEEALGLPSSDYRKPTVVIYTKAVPVEHPALRREGKALQLLRIPRNTPEGPVRLKSLHYMNNILAKRELSTYPAQPQIPQQFAHGSEGLMLTAEGYLAEGIVSNIFYVRDQILFTPSLETGILPGITRGLVIEELAAEAGCSVREGLFRWEDLLQADEVFITNSIQEIVPISVLLDTQSQSVLINQGRTGRLTDRLIVQYKRKAGV
ncbi:4-amino-4-deoxychorismate lyase [Paenibacillus swuensis]|uniref:4-amino-4-deoxychorismate lyase n=1 Tax=Paenibacillus swuensis TaxID=1178515 RepID=A0A172TFY8_9BACL|nr:aminodeoxychorismate lyase [Paenibacillus swuensis]ANE45969.1 4-amino-4-deoxychorismate lyase [Paenibacillus swuensis]